MAREDDDKEVSLRDTLDAAFDDATGDETDAGDIAGKDDKPVVPAKVEKPIADDKTAKPDDKAAPKDKDAPKDDKPKYSYKEPPSRWTAEAKESWATTFGALDIEGNPTHKQIGALRDMMFQRAHESEEQFATRTAELETRANALDGISKVIEPYRAQIEQGGEKVEKAVADLLQLNQFATTRPEEFVRWFCQQRRLDPTKLFGTAPAAPGVAPSPGAGDDDDPLGIIPQHIKEAAKAVPALVAHIQRLEAGLNQVGGSWQAHQTAQNAQQVQAAGTYISQWASEKDASGAPMRPYYADPAIRGAMLTMLDSKQHTDLNTAYEAAIWANPATRAELMASQKASHIAETERTAREAAAKKRNAAAGLGQRPAIGGGSPTPSSGGGGDLRSLLSSAWDETSAGL